MTLRRFIFPALTARRGQILEDLYSFSPTRLLASPGAKGLKDNDSSLADFFLWLGVANFPAEVRIPVSDVRMSSTSMRAGT